MKNTEMAYDQEHDLDPSLHAYELDPQLRRDTVYLGHFKLCDLLLMNDANYPWFILVPRRADVSELFHLGQADQQQLMKESCFLAETLNDVFDAEKMNVAALGNLVGQLHVHHVVRYEDDASWPQPVWGKVPPQAYDAERRQDVINRVLALLEDNQKADMDFACAEDS